jgi:hypothetical protein
MKISKQKIKKIITESFEKVLNESDFDMEKIGRRGMRGRIPVVDMTGPSEGDIILRRCRSRYPDIMKNDDISFIGFIVNTGKLSRKEDIDALMKKKEELEKEIKDRVARRHPQKATGAGRIMFEGEESDEP